MNFMTQVIISELNVKYRYPNSHSLDKLMVIPFSSMKEVCKNLLITQFKLNEDQESIYVYVNDDQDVSNCFIAGIVVIDNLDIRNYEYYSDFVNRGGEIDFNNLLQYHLKKVYLFVNNTVEAIFIDIINKLFSDIYYLLFLKNRKQLIWSHINGDFPIYLFEDEGIRVDNVTKLSTRFYGYIKGAYDQYIMRKLQIGKKK